MNESSKVLALETTDVTGSVALCENGEVLAVRRLSPDQRSARSLAPAIRDILLEYSWRPTDVDVVAVTIGPGSFTGLRVGVATAKMFAWSIGAKIVGVDVLDAIVEELDFSVLPSVSTGQLVSVGFDAQRGDVALRNYWLVRDDEPQIFALAQNFRVFSIKKWLSDSFTTTLNDPSNVCSKYGSVYPLASEDVLEEARHFNCGDVFFTGPVLERVKNRTAIYPEKFFASEDAWIPTAAGVARVAWKRIQRESFDDPLSILPVYSRLAAAEERALEKKRLAESSLAAE